jgi:hypothetical protein
LQNRSRTRAVLPFRRLEAELQTQLYESRQVRICNLTVPLPKDRFGRLELGIVEHTKELGSNSMFALPANAGFVKHSEIKVIDFLLP